MNNDPYRILMFGRPGVGKSTWAAQAPSPTAISPEFGMNRINGRNGKRVHIQKGVQSFTDTRKKIVELSNTKHDFQTLILDTADWVEQACHADIIGTSNKDIIRINGGYGSGYRESESRHREMIYDLNKLVFDRGLNVIVTAHYGVKPEKNPEAVADYDSFKIKCHEYVSALWREWSDAVLFARFETFVKAADENSEKTFATGTDRRLLSTVSRPAYPEVKNRLGLPAEMNLNFADFERIVNPPTETDEDVRQELSNLSHKLSGEDATKMMNAFNAADGDLAQMIKIRNYARTKVK